MKFPLPALFLVASVFVAGCNSLENPLGGLLNTGRDARVYNSQTGEYEWPKDSQKPRAPKPLTSTAATAERQGDGRYFDIQKNQWVDAREERAAAPRTKARPAPVPPGTADVPPPVVAPPPAPPARASGIYNPSTGQIEWKTSDPAPAAAPASRKSWYWPF